MLFSLLYFIFFMQLHSKVISNSHISILSYSLKPNVQVVKIVQHCFNGIVTDSKQINPLFYFCLSLVSSSVFASSKCSCRYSVVLKLYMLNNFCSKLLLNFVLQGFTRFQCQRNSLFWKLIDVVLLVNNCK